MQAAAATSQAAAAAVREAQAASLKEYLLPSSTFPPPSTINFIL